ncbi:MAG: GNAT family N-acetyltransferase [Vicinamibacterales bacterium]
MEAYFNGQHHPQQALLPRTGYVALNGDQVIGYIAGHRTNRHGCAAEVQYLFVAPAYRRRELPPRCFACSRGGSMNKLPSESASVSLMTAHRRPSRFSRALARVH